MAHIEERALRSVSHKHHRSLKVDLTPMVDLGFLLITFFILTTSMSQLTATHLIMPKDTDGPKILVQQSAVLNVLLLKDHTLSYSEPGEPVAVSSYAGIRSVILSKQKKVLAKLGDKDKTILIIRPSKESTYGEFMQIIDEIQINDVKHYFVVD